MLTENFRTIQNGPEITALIQQANQDEYGQIWQTVGPLRQVYQITLMTINRENEAILFETQAPFEFDRDYPVYVRITHRNVIFKLDQNYETKKNRMICSLPHEVKATEYRTNSRYSVPNHRNVELVLKPQQTSAADITVKLNNFSQTGMGIAVSVVNQEYFKKINTFSVQSIGGIKIGDKKSVQVKYIGKGLAGVPQVGLSLDQPFDNGTFSYLQNFLL